MEDSDAVDMLRVVVLLSCCVESALWQLLCIGSFVEKAIVAHVFVDQPEWSVERAAAVVHINFDLLIMLLLQANASLVDEGAFIRSMSVVEEAVTLYCIEIIRFRKNEPPLALE